MWLKVSCGSATLTQIMEDSGRVVHFLIFGSTESLMLCRLFSSCCEWGLVANRGVQASLVELRLQELGHTGFSRYSMWAQHLRLPGSRAWAQQSRLLGLVALRHAGSSQPRDGTHVILHWQVASLPLNP